MDVAVVFFRLESERGAQGVVCLSVVPDEKGIGNHQLVVLLGLEGVGDGDFRQDRVLGYGHPRDGGVVLALLLGIDIHREGVSRVDGIGETQSQWPIAVAFVHKGALEGVTGASAPTSVGLGLVGLEMGCVAVSVGDENGGQSIENCTFKIPGERVAVLVPDLDVLCRSPEGLLLKSGHRRGEGKLVYAGSGVFIAQEFGERVLAQETVEQDFGCRGIGGDGAFSAAVGGGRWAGNHELLLEGDLLIGQVVEIVAVDILEREYLVVARSDVPELESPVFLALGNVVRQGITKFPVKLLP